MAALSNAFMISGRRPSLRFSNGASLKSANQLVVPNNLAFGFDGTKRLSTQKRTPFIQASFSDGARPTSASIFIGGFVLGGLIVGTLGCLYAPQITDALAATDGKDLMKKLPKFIYDEEKALEKQRKKLAEKIEQLNLAIDNMSNQLRSEDPPNGTAATSDNVEAHV